MNLEADDRAPGHDAVGHDAAGPAGRPAAPQAVTRELVGSVAAHAVLALGLGAAALADDLPPGWHLPLGAAGAVLFVLWLVMRLWRSAPNLPRPWGRALPPLRLALAVVVALLAASGVLLGHETWGVRSAVDQAHEGLTVTAAVLLALHALVEWGALGWARWEARRR